MTKSLLSLATLICIFCVNVYSVSLPYDRKNPVIYINDQLPDNYGSECALALASNGSINLVGNICSYPIDHWMTDSQYTAIKKQYIHHHRLCHRKALKSGFKNLPGPVLGVFERHKKPVSGKISDTKAIGSAGTDLIIREAHKCSPEVPLVIVTGGNLCTVADAFLQDPSIADKVIIAARLYKKQDLQITYNVQSSGWSLSIVLKKLKVVCFPGSNGMTPYITRSEVLELPDTPLKDYMLGFAVKVKKINSNFWPVFYQKPVFVSKFTIPALFIWIHSK